jgi:hypothetical protein
MNNTTDNLRAVDLPRHCSACRWSMPLDGRYDQLRCCNDDSEEAWGNVEATQTCPLFERHTCGSCKYYTGEECNGPGGSREGSEVYDETPACDEYAANNKRFDMVPESELINIKYWCAMCGKWGDHQSGTCPQLHS